MNPTALTNAATRLLERMRDAHPKTFRTSARSRASARELVEAGLITCEDDVCTFTPAGLDRMGLKAGPVAPGAGKPPREGSKAARVIAMLGRPEGATISQLSEATDWLPHSVRGFLAGALKKTHGLSAASGLEGEVRIYRLAGQ